MANNKVILLLSGGFDSSIAGYLLQKQGYEIIPLHFSNVDFAGEESIEKSLLITEKFQWKKMYVIDIADTQGARFIFDIRGQPDVQNGLKVIAVGIAGFFHHQFGQIVFNGGD